MVAWNILLWKVAVRLASFQAIANCKGEAMSFSVRYLFAICAFAWLSSCGSPSNNPDLGNAVHIFVRFGSVWGGSFEIELPKSGDGASIFEQSQIESLPYGSGKRAAIENGSVHFQTFSKALKDLERRSVTEFKTDEIQSGRISMGYPCGNSSTDAMMLVVEWRYPNNRKRHAAYYAGCKNEFTKMSWPKILKLGEEVLGSVPSEDWKPSKMRDAE
jgi:hypothetical protein